MIIKYFTDFKKKFHNIFYSLNNNSLFNLPQNRTCLPTKQKHTNKPQTTAFCVCMFENNSFLDQDSSLKFCEDWTVGV